MTFRLATLLLVGVFILHFSRSLFLGEVIFPHDNSLEAGAVEGDAGARISNRKFSDESSAFIPELANNLGSQHKAWLDTWNPHVQLGRAAFHGALSRAFALTNLLSCFTSSPFALYTALILLTVGLTAGFLLALLCDVPIGHLLDGLFVVAHHGIYAKTIVGCSVWAGFCHVLPADGWLSAGHDFVRLHDRGICSDQARANA